MEQTIISNWQPEYAGLFSKQDLVLQHRLHETGLFTREALCNLIERYPEHLYNLNTMGFDPLNPVWREGTTQGHAGEAVFEAIERGRMWLNLRAVQEVDEAYGRILDRMLDEFESQVPGFSSFKRKLGILISSPKVMVFYHCDIPGQALWQIQGEKKVYVYPNQPPYLPQDSLENVIMGVTEEEIPYDVSFDEGANVYDLKPGQMVHWPLNCPHRVVNEDSLNISLTTEHWTSEIRKSYAVNYANGILRRNFGVRNLSQSTQNWSVYPKAALALSWRKLGLNKMSQFVRKIDFTVDPNSDTGMRDIPEFIK